MTNATPAERSELIAGLRALADYLEKRPNVPVPRAADVMVFTHSANRDVQSNARQVAVCIEPAIVYETSASGHREVPRNFGPVTYRVIVIPAGPPSKEAGA